MRMILVHHGRVEDSSLHEDPPLSDLGRREAESIAAEIATSSARGQAVVAVHSSPLLAARETSERIAERLSLATPNLEHSLSSGNPQVTPSEADLDALSALQERAWSVVETLREQHADDAVLVLVTHELPIRLMVARALDMQLTDLQRFRIHPASLTVLELRSQPQRRVLLGALNEVCHLD